MKTILAILSKAAAERLPGGKAEGQPDAKYDQQQLRDGTEVEMEHTDDPEVAKEIAKDHLEESGDTRETQQAEDKLRYYDLLDQLEQQIEAQLKKSAHLIAPLIKQAAQLDDTAAQRLAHLLVPGADRSVAGLTDRLRRLGVPVA